MPVIDCPITDCEYATPDVDPIVAAALITTHATIHNATASPAAIAKVEKVKRPTISSAGTSEDWTYFLSRWTDYVEATKVSGKDKVIQLLECCDEHLRKDLTRTAGGTLTNKSEAEVITVMKTLAVREENTMVARVTLHNMRHLVPGSVARQEFVNLLSNASIVITMLTMQRQYYVIRLVGA